VNVGNPNGRIVGFTTASGVIHGIYSWCNKVNAR